MSSLLLLKSMLFANSLQNKSKIAQDIVIKKTQKARKVPARKDIINKDSVMCRICDQERGVIPIFNNDIQPNIPEDILHFSSVTIDQADGLSKLMCRNCLDLLNGCIMFKDICQRTNKKLIEMAVKKEINLDSEMNGDGECSEPERPGDSNDNDSFGEISEFTCKFCNTEYCDHATLASHKKICKKRKKTRPKGCDKTTKTKFLCDVCGKTSVSNASLLAHKTTHETIFPFKCEECPYMGRTLDLLKVHKRSHLSEKPYKCSVCAKATTTASNLAKHIRHVHSSNRPYKCNYCEKAFSYQHDMKRHVKDIHLRQNTVQCDLCFKKFNTSKILRGHRWKVHKLKGKRSGRLPAYLEMKKNDDNAITDECESERSSWQTTIQLHTTQQPEEANRTLQDCPTDLALPSSIFY